MAPGKWIPNPEPYDWQPHQCNTDGVPHVKTPGVKLERNGVIKSFKTQGAVDAAWADGWHDTYRPETADVMWQEDAPTKVTKPRTETPPKEETKPERKWGKPAAMNKKTLIAYGKEVLGLKLDPKELKAVILIKVRAERTERGI